MTATAGLANGIFVASSSLPANITPALRLREYLHLVQEMSEKRDPQEMLLSYGARARFVVHGEQIVSFSRRDVPEGRVRVTRSSRWETPINPWKDAAKLPVIDSPFILRLMDAGQPVKIDDLRGDEDDSVAPYLEGMRSLLAAPVFHEGKPLYLTLLMHSEPGVYTLDDLSNFLLTTNLLGRATSQLVTADLLQKTYAALDREFSAVGEIQRRLLPRSLPTIPGFSVSTYYETSTRAGGDYYDFFQLDGGRWGFVIADVSGHGAAAAVVMALMHAFMKAPLRSCEGATATPVEMLHRLNSDLVNAVNPSQFVTAFLGIYDPATRELRYANAGHNPPRWLRAGASEVIELKVEPGLPLGIIPNYECFEAAVRLSPGDRLIFYTDGITETFSAAGVMFGAEGLDASLRCCAKTPEGLIASIMHAVREHGGAGPAKDDRTLVAVAVD